MSDPRVQQHWPHLVELIEMLEGLNGKTIRLQLDPRGIRDALLKLQRQSGSLGFK